MIKTMDFTPMKLFTDRSLMTGTRLFSTKSGTMSQIKTSLITPQQTVHSNYVPYYSALSPNKKFTNPNYNIDLIPPKFNLVINTMKDKVKVPETSGSQTLNSQNDIMTILTDTNINEAKPHTEVRNKNSPRRNKRVIKQNKINSKNHSLAKDTKSHTKQNILRDIDSDRFTIENSTIIEDVNFGELYEMKSPVGSQNAESLDRLESTESLEVPRTEETSKKNNFTFPIFQKETCNNIAAMKSKKRRPISPNNAFYRNVIEQISLERKTNRPESITRTPSTNASRQDSEIYSIIPIKNSTCSYEIQFSEAKCTKPKLYSQKPNTIEKKLFYDSCANFGTIFHKTIECKPTYDCDIDDFIVFEQHDESDENISFNSESSIDSEMGCRKMSDCESEDDIVFNEPITRPVSRARQTSECDSEDSFVVFDRSGCDQVDGYDYDEELSDSESEDDEEEVGHDESRYIPTCSSTPNKKVQFKEDPQLCTVHRMVKWNYAYRKARKGPWEQQARDSERFRHRINTMDTTIGAILQPEHRRHVYNERFS